MADRRVTEDTTITAGAVSSADWFDLVDVSDTTDAASGTNKKISAADVASVVSTLLNLAATYQPVDSDLTAIAALTTTTFGRALLTMADASALRTTAGLVIGTDVQPADSDLTAIAALTTTTFGRALLTMADAAALRSTAGLVIGTNVQAYDATLAGLAATSPTTDQLTYWTGTDTAGTTAFPAAARTLLALTTLLAQQQYLEVQGINAQTGTTYTLAASDQSQLITQSNASAITTTVPQDSAVTFPVGGWTELYQLGAGQITVAAGAGATLRATPTAKARAQYSRLFLQKISANTWALSGDIAAT